LPRAGRTRYVLFLTYVFSCRDYCLFHLNPLGVGAFPLDTPSWVFFRNTVISYTVTHFVAVLATLCLF